MRKKRLPPKGQPFSIRKTVYQILERLFGDRRNNAGTDGSAAFTDSEAEAFFHRDGGDQLDVEVEVIAGHRHLSAFGQGDDTGNVGSRTADGSW